MSLATVHANLRAAFRERLLTLTDIDHSPGVSVSLASGVFTRASGSWLDAGFAPGMELTITGFSTSPLYAWVDKLTATVLTTGGVFTRNTETGVFTAASLTQTLAGGGRFVVGLPQGRAWEGFDFFPIDGRPYVSESFRAVQSQGLTVGDYNGPGTVAHTIEASATFFYPKNKGTLAIERMAGACMALFRRGSTLSRSGDGVTIRNSSRSEIYDDGARIGCAVNVSLPAYTQN